MLSVVWACPRHQERLRSAQREALASQNDNARGVGSDSYLRKHTAQARPDKARRCPELPQIILAATGEPTCPVAALRRLFIQDSRPHNAPLFRLQSSAFSRQAVVNILKQRIGAASLPEANYSGHSLCKGAAKHVADYGMLDESIQRLGRWTSNAFKLYFTTNPDTLFHLNLSFQRGMPIAVPRTTFQQQTVTAMQRPKPRRQVSLKS